MKFYFVGPTELLSDILFYNFTSYELSDVVVGRLSSSDFCLFIRLLQPTSSLSDLYNTFVSVILNYYLTDTPLLPSSTTTVVPKTGLVDLLTSTVGDFTFSDIHFVRTPILFL